MGQPSSPFSLVNQAPQNDGAPANPFRGDIHHGGTATSEVDVSPALLESLLLLAKGPRSLPEDTIPTMILAPRAGYGKSCLLDRLRAKLGAETPLVFLEFPEPTDISPVGVLRQLLIFSSSQPSDGPNWLEESTRAIFGRLTGRLVDQGRIPCADKSQALAHLKHSSATVFAPGRTDQVIGSWFRKNFNQLLPAYAREWIPEAQCAESMARDWLQWAFSLDNETELPWELRREIFLDHINRLDGRTAIRLLSGMLARVRPWLFVVDHLDRYFRNPVAGMDLATLILDLPELCEGAPVLAAMNEDLWQASFAGHLPSAYEDRMTSKVLNLSGLTLQEGQQLLRFRFTRQGTPEAAQSEFLSILDLPGWFASHPERSVSPRQLLRFAAEKWTVWQNTLQGGEDPSLAEPLPGLLDESLFDQPEQEPDFSFVDTGAAVPAGAPPLLTAPAPTLSGSPFHLVGSGTSTPPPAPDKPHGEKEDHFHRLREMLAQMQSLGAAATTPVPPVEKPRPAVPPPSTADFAPAPLKTSPKATPLPTVSPAPPQETIIMPPVIASSEEAVATAQAARTDTAVTSAPQTDPDKDPASGSVPPPPPTRPQPVEMEMEVELDPHASVADRYLAVRDALAGANLDLSVDLAGISELVRLAGKRFPVVVFDEWSLPSLPGSRVLRWTYEKNEILIGTEPTENTRYWRNLLDYAERRRELVKDKETPDSPAGFLKVVVLAEEESAPQKEGFLKSWNMEHAEDLIDWLFLDRWSIASLQSADQVIRQAVNQPAAGRPGEVLRLLSTELAFFWKKLTRPPHKTDPEPPTPIRDASPASNGGQEGRDAA